MKETPRITIGGEQRPIKFGTNASAIMCDLRGMDYQTYMEKIAAIADGKFTIGFVRDLIYSGLKAAELSEKGKSALTPEQVGDWMDDMAQTEGEEMFVTVFRIFSESMPEPTGDEEEKKSQ